MRTWWKFWTWRRTQRSPAQWTPDPGDTAPTVIWTATNKPDWARRDEERINADTLARVTKDWPIPSGAIWIEVNERTADRRKSFIREVIATGLEKGHKTYAPGRCLQLADNDG